MKLYSRVLLLLYFGTTVLLIGIGSIVEFIKEYYPIAKSAIISFVQKRYKSHIRSKSQYGGLTAV